jgi:hypothetical protein
VSAPAANPVLQQLATSVVHLGTIIGAPLWALPTFGYPTSRSYPYVLDRDGRFVWGVRSGDFELERRETDRAEEILYWIFEHVTRSMVTASEAGAGLPNTTGDDWPAKQHALLGRLTPRWAARFAAEHEGWLDLGPDPDLGGEPGADADHD